MEWLWSVTIPWLWSVYRNREYMTVECDYRAISRRSEINQRTGVCVTYVCMYNIWRMLSYMCVSHMYSYIICDIYSIPRRLDPGGGGRAADGDAPIWMSRVSRVWVSHVIHMNESRHTYEENAVLQVVVHLYEWVVCHTYEWVMSHIWTSQDTHVSMWEAVLPMMKHTWGSHVTHVSGEEAGLPMLIHTYEWVVSYIWVSHVAHVNAWRHTYEWGGGRAADGDAPIWMSRVTHMSESCHTYEWVKTHMWVRRR